MSARNPRRRSSARSGRLRARSLFCSHTKNTSMCGGSGRSEPIESRRRSMPAPKPIPGPGGPPWVVLVEPLRELLEVGRTAVAVADRVELEHVVGHPDAAQEL